MPKVVVQCAQCGVGLERWPSQLKKSKTGNQYCSYQCFADSEASGLAERQRNKTHCPQGHEYSEGNVMFNSVSGGRVCKKCHARDQRNRRLKKHGLTESGLLRMLRKQRGRCAICDNKINRKTLRIDHCHRRNKRRALLCNSCNVGLGQFRDNIEYLQSAIKYLEHWNGKEVRT